MTLVTSAVGKKKLLEQVYEREAKDVILKFYETIESNVVFAKNEPDSLIGVITYPNSGTSWFLQLALAATNIEIHTIYHEEIQKAVGQKSRGAYVIDTNIGHLPDADEPALVKSHVNKYSTDYDAGAIHPGNFAQEAHYWLTSLPPNSTRFIRLVRNPFDNLRGRYHLYLKMNSGKSFVLSFSQFFRADLRRYLVWHAFCNQVAKVYPLLSMHYADLLRGDNGYSVLQQAMQFAGFDITPDDAVRAYNRFPPLYEGKFSIPQHLVNYTESDIIWVAEEIRKWLETLSELERTSYRKECLKKRFRLDFKPEPGTPSEKAERLVKFCLGEYYEKPAPACTGNLVYLENESIMLLEVTHDSMILSAGLSHGLLDQKKIVTALIDQRAAIPNGLRCWLVRGDGAGISTEPGQGLHIAGMRKFSSRDIALVPTAGRDRYLGLNLRRQLEEFRQLWVPWEEKTDTAWWGGALTGSHWFKQEPCTLTRHQVLCHFRDHPSDQVHLQLTELQSGDAASDGIKVMNQFTKKSAFMNKCMILLPGNDIASGSSWYFAGNSVVLMPKPHLEHILYFEMEPWEHYVPLENDPQDILVKLNWVLENQEEAKQIVSRSHERLRWLSGPEYQWACNEVLRKLAISITNTS